MDPEVKAIIAARRAASSGLGRALRQAAGLSQAEAGRACGVSGPAIARWETGSRTPRGEAAVRYAALVEDIREATA